jgi:uncharacterized protein YuzE
MGGLMKLVKWATGSEEEEKEPDNLKVDEPINGQSKCLISLMSDENGKVIGFKVRQAGDNLDPVPFRNMDPEYDVFQADVGTWTPLPGVTLSQLNEQAGKSEKRLK